jgi:hypothetical protein
VQLHLEMQGACSLSASKGLALHEQYAATDQTVNLKVAGLGNTEQQRELLPGHAVGYRQGSSLSGAPAALMDVAQMRVHQVRGMPRRPEAGA